MRAKQFVASTQQVARALSRRYGITVKCSGKHCYTDGKTVYLPDLPPDADRGMVRALRGCADHEIGHILFTNCQYRKEDGLEGAIHNALEDARIEERLRQDYPGARINLAQAREWYEGQVDEKQENLPQEKQLSIGCYERACGRDAKQWAPDVQDALDKVDDLCKKARTAGDTSETGLLAAAVMNRLDEYMEDEDEQQEQPGEGEDGGGDADEQGQSGEDDEGQPTDDEDETTDEGEGESGEGDEEEPAGPEDSEEQEEDSGDADDADEGQDGSNGDGNSEGEPADGDGENPPHSIQGKGEEDSGADGGDSGEPDGGSEEREDSESDGQPSLTHDPDGEPNIKLDPDSEEDGGMGENMAEELENAIENEFEEANDAGGYRVFSREKDEVYRPEPNEERKERIMDRIEGLADTARERLFRVVQSRDRTLHEHDKKHGQVDPASLHRAALGTSNRVFRRRRRVQGGLAAVTLLVDLSGSMAGDRIERARRAAMALGQALDTLGCPLEVLGFATADKVVGTERNEIGERTVNSISHDEEKRRKEEFVRAEPLRLAVCKRWEERWQDAADRIAGVEEQAFTPTGEAIQWAVRRMIERPEQRKILLVLTDGGAGYDGSEDNICRNHCREAVEIAERAGIDVVGLGLHTEEDVMDQQFDRYVMVEGENLAEDVFAQLADEIERIGQIA